MPHAKITVTLPEGTWIGTVSETHSGVRFRVLSVLPGDGGTGVGLLELNNRTASLAAVVDDIAAHEGVTAVDILQEGPDRALLRFETDQPRILLAAQQSGVPLDFPITIRDGSAVLEMVTTHDSLSELGERFDAFGLEYTVDHIRQFVDSEDLLTERQRDLLETAIELGYYDTPRGCTLTELADRLDMAKSTASERLHRIEGSVLKAFVSDGADRGLEGALRS